MPKFYICFLLLFFSCAINTTQNNTKQAAQNCCLAPAWSAAGNIQSTPAQPAELKVKTRFSVYPKYGDPKTNGGFLITESASSQIFDMVFNLFKLSLAPDDMLFKPQGDPEQIKKINRRLVYIQSKLMDAHVMDKQEVKQLLAESNNLHDLLSSYKQVNFQAMKALNMSLAILLENAVQHGWKKQPGCVVPVEIGMTEHEIIIRLTSPYLPEAQIDQRFLYTPLVGQLSQMGNTSKSPYAKYKEANSQLSGIIRMQFPEGSFVFYKPETKFLKDKVQPSLCTYLVVSLSDLPQKTMQQRMAAIHEAFEQYAYDTGVVFSAA